MVKEIELEFTWIPIFPLLLNKNILEFEYRTHKSNDKLLLSVAQVNTFASLRRCIENLHINHSRGTPDHLEDKSAEHFCKSIFTLLIKIKP
jgi:hypothetical protein